MKHLFLVVAAIVFALGCAIHGHSEAGVPITIKPTPQLPQVVSRELLTQLARGKIEVAMIESGETRRYKIEATSVPAGVRLPPGKIDYEPYFPSGLRYGKRMQVWINIDVDGKRYTQVRCTMIVRLYEKMVVASRQISPEEVLTQADVRLEERELMPDSRAYYTNVDDVLGLTPKRTMTQGMIFYKLSLQQPMVIKQRSNVKIKAVVNGIEVSVDGVALGNGRIGEFISVKNTVSGKIIRAKVVDANTVINEGR